jgi:hypothetical protein
VIEIRYSTEEPWMHGRTLRGYGLQRAGSAGSNAILQEANYCMHQSVRLRHGSGLRQPRAGPPRW